MLNKNFIDYCIKLLLKNRTEYLFTFIIFTFIVSVLSSVLFISDSIKYDLLSNIKKDEQIIVKNTRAGKYEPLFESHLDEIIQLHGVENVEGRIDGFYNFAQGERYIRILTNDELDDEKMIVSEDIKELFKKFHYKEEFNFLTPERKITMEIANSIPSNILSHNTIFINSDMAREILQMSEDEYSYFTVFVPNENEIDFIARKIVDIFPYTIAIQDRNLQASYRHIFYYKGGLFMILYVVCLLSFLILLKNQISSLFGERKKEIAILRSIGFSIKDIILLKFIQNSVVSISAFITGIFIAYVFVFIFNAPLLKYIFLGEGMAYLEFTTFIDFRILFLMFMFTVIPYLAFVLIPAWKVAISDISEVMK